MRQILLTDPDSLIPYFHGTGFIVGRDQDLCLMVGRIFAGIIQQIRENPFQ